MSDYVHNKALRYKPTEEDINKIYTEMLEWRKEHPDDCRWIHDRDDWGDYLESVKFEELFDRKYKKDVKGYFDIGFGTSERYLDFILYSDYGEESGEWYKARYTTPNEQNKYRETFEQIFPGLDMNRVHVVDYCWYNCCEPEDCWDPEADDFNEEV